MTKVLVCGVGGIGCELLKTVVYDKYDITVVDLDTIDISNLNRQLLFDTSHVGKPKALIAQQVIKKLYDVDIVAYFKNLFEFEPKFFKDFDLVFNCLDNYEARYHISIMCKAFRIPLIDIGSGGNRGQVLSISGDLDGTQCYACIERNKEETFPVCTIRSNPSKFIHVITWTKEYLFQQLFGDENDLEIPEEATEQDEAILNQQQLAFTSLRKDINDPKYFLKVFEKLFISDITTIATMKEWTTPTPVPLTPALLDGNFKEKPLTESVDLPYCAFLFKIYLKKLQQRFLLNKEPIVFEKDDYDTLIFTSACSNLRAHCFHIPLVDTFTVKAMAGKIVPIVATTNAIVAGVAALKAKKILKIKNYEFVKAGYTGTQIARLLDSQNITPSVPECFVCHADFAMLYFNKSTTISDLILKLQKLKNVDVELFCNEHLIYDVEFTENEHRKLIEFYDKSHFVTADFDGFVPLKMVIMDKKYFNINVAVII